MIASQFNKKLIEVCEQLHKRWPESEPITRFQTCAMVVVGENPETRTLALLFSNLVQGTNKLIEKKDFSVFEVLAEKVTRADCFDRARSEIKDLDEKQLSEIIEPFSNFMIDWARLWTILQDSEREHVFAHLCAMYQYGTVVDCLGDALNKYEGLARNVQANIKGKIKSSDLPSVASATIDELFGNDDIHKVIEELQQEATSTQMNKFKTMLGVDADEIAKQLQELEAQQKEEEETKSKIEKEQDEARIKQREKRKKAKAKAKAAGKESAGTKKRKEKRKAAVKTDDMVDSKEEKKKPAEVLPPVVERKESKRASTATATTTADPKELAIKNLLGSDMLQNTLKRFTATQPAGTQARVDDLMKSGALAKVLKGLKM